MMDFDNLISTKNVVYRYISGSTLYHTNEEGKSDIDTKGVFIAPFNELLSINHEVQINDEKNDNTLYEIGRFIELLIKSNPNMLESLFVPSEMMIVKPHECLEPLFANRDIFITKRAFEPFVKFSLSQIKKARGLNKKIVNPVNEKKGVLDFTYTFYNQGSTKIQNWLEYRGLPNEYCGLVCIPNMKWVYGVYYDWGAFFSEKEITLDKLKENKILTDFITKFYQLSNDSEFEDWFGSQKTIGYRGMANKNSLSLILSSVSKGEKPICYISFNIDGYRKHCKEYYEYKEWEKNRNQHRYESNLHKNYDSKNMYHCIRLMHMGREIAEGKGIILNREIAGDKDFIMDVRHHKYEYDELMSIIDKEEKELINAVEISKIPNEIDEIAANDILIEVRKRFYKAFNIF